MATEMVNIRVRADEAIAILQAGRCRDCGHLMAVHNYHYDYGTEDCWMDDCDCSTEDRGSGSLDEIAIKQMGL